MGPKKLFRRGCQINYEMSGKFSILKNQVFQFKKRDAGNVTYYPENSIKSTAN
jgi:hypothetical protein